MSEKEETGKIQARRRKSRRDYDGGKDIFFEQTHRPSGALLAALDAVGKMKKKPAR